MQAFAVFGGLPLKQRAVLNRDNTVIELGVFNLTKQGQKVFSR
jgi:hypothetical protein